jgi:CRISPR-associated Cas5-like protein
MTTFFTIRVVAPVATFSGPVIGEVTRAQPIPSPSVVTGLLGAALGIDRARGADLQAIQDDLVFAYAFHHAVVIEPEFFTADLSTPHMSKAVVDHDNQRAALTQRFGGDKTRRLTGGRELVCDLDMTVVVQNGEAVHPSSTYLAALAAPAYPLTAGARSCPLSESACGVLLAATTLDEAIAAVISARPVSHVYRPIDGEVDRDTRVISLSTRNFRTNRFGGSHLYYLS